MSWVKRGGKSLPQWYTVSMNIHPVSGLFLLHSGCTECQGQKAPPSLALKYCNFLISSWLTRALLDNACWGPIFFFFLELICDTVCGQAVRTSDFMCCHFWPYKGSLFVLIKFREWWCCAQKLLGLAQARRKWVPWVQRLEYHMGKLLGEFFFFFQCWRLSSGPCMC